MMLLQISNCVIVLKYKIGVSMIETIKFLKKFNQLLNNCSKKEIINDSLSFSENSVATNLKNYSNEYNKLFLDFDEEFYTLIQELLIFSDMNLSMITSVIFFSKSQEQYLNVSFWKGEISFETIEPQNVFQPDKFLVSTFYDIEVLKILDLNSYTDSFVKSGELFAKINNLSSSANYVNIRNKNAFTRRMGYNINEVLHIVSFEIKGSN